VKSHHTLATAGRQQQCACLSNIKINQAYKSVYGLRKPSSDKVISIQP